MKHIIINELQDFKIKNFIFEMLDTNTIQNNNTNNPAGNITIGLRGGDEQAPLNQNMQNTMNTIKKTPGANNLLNNGATMNVEGSVSGQEVEANFQTKNESILLTKKQLKEVHLRKIKENSNKVKIKDFLKEEFYNNKHDDIDKWLNDADNRSKEPFGEILKKIDNYTKEQGIDCYEDEYGILQSPVSNYITRYYCGYSNKKTVAKIIYNIIEDYDFLGDLKMKRLINQMLKLSNQ